MFLVHLPGLAPGREEMPEIGSGALGTIWVPWATNTMRNECLFQTWLLAMFGEDCKAEFHPFRVPFWVTEIL